MADLHDFITQEFFEKNSVAALVWLIGKGREAEIFVDGTKVFISMYPSAKKVSLWCNKTEQAFDSMDELLEKATVNGKPFLKLWNSAEAETLY